MLGRLFSAKHAEGGGHGTGHGHVGELSMSQHMLPYVLAQTGPGKIADIVPLASGLSEGALFSQSLALYLYRSVQQMGISGQMGADALASPVLREGT
jgi:hypothetical protein